MSEMRCVLAGVQLRDDRDFTERFQETNALCEACGFVTVGTLVQRSRTLDPNTGLRSGKAAELAALCRQSSADIIVLHNNVSAGCAARLAQLTETEVIDRTALILRIFSMRARTKEARLQTEIARLSYLLPVSTSEDTESHKRGGSYANRGAGEMRRAQLASRYRGRIAALKKELAALERRGMQSEKRRNESMLKKAALVGYTNAGKSSLLNALISMSESTPGKEAGVRDMLFATLDTSVRSVTYGTASFFLYDTVGFVSDLPHELIEAFHSTLRAACDADLLIHVIDGSDPMREMKTEAAEQALQDIGASGIPSIRVYTKCDLVKDRHEGFMYVSSLTKEGIGDLLQTTADLLYGADTCLECVIPYDKMQLYERYSRVMRCTVLAQTENGLHVIMRGSENYMKLFRVYERKDYEQNSMGKTE